MSDLPIQSVCNRKGEFTFRGSVKQQIIARGFVPIGLFGPVCSNSSRPFYLQLGIKVNDE